MMNKKKHINIPIFIPHVGCPHDCIFCNQRRISGQNQPPSLSQIHEIINRHLESARPEDLCEIAFFGGSFTGIPALEQEEYLKIAESYVKRGFVSGIRLSTRPDYINENILKFLKKYSVKVIELGIQSLDIDVLNNSSRFYKPEEAIKACNLIKQYGFSLGAQTMIGLPGDTFEKSLETAKIIISIKPDMVRIYPTLVIRDTGLEEIYAKGEYQPLSVDEAVLWCSKLVQMYEAAGITILRVGLHDAGGLQEKSDAVAGPMHPAFGELVYSKIWLDKVIKELSSYGSIEGKNLIIYVPSYEVSKATGQHRSNIDFLKKHFNLSGVKISPYNVNILSNNLKTLPDDKALPDDDKALLGDDKALLDDRVLYDNVKKLSGDDRVSHDNVKTSSNNVKTLPDNAKTPSGNVKTLRDNAKTPSGNVKNLPDNAEPLPHNDEIALNKDMNKSFLIELH
ncbi:MAG: radical SAM protein [Ruminiclostridium sp.]|nr:radical SAM protein [Ruminiclostridium sp.]